MNETRILRANTRRALVLLLSLLLLAFQGWALKPDRVYHTLPDSLGLAYTAADVKTPDGYTLKTWTFVPAPASARHVTVVLAYQDLGNMSYLLHQVHALHRAGYHVVTFDYRGFGQSSDFPINQNQLYYTEFVEDFRTVVREARRRFPNQKLGAFSLSMGTLVASTVAAEGQLDFLIGEGFIADPQDVVRAIKQLKNKDIVLPASAGAYPGLLAQAKCPMLIFAGRQDPVTTLAAAQQVVASSRKRELVEFEGGHLGGFVALSPQPLSYATFGDLYVERVSSFLRKRGIGKHSTRNRADG